MSGGDTGALKREACQAIDAAADELIAFGEDIFRHPELGFKEERTGQKVAGAFCRARFAGPCPPGAHRGKRLAASQPARPAHRDFGRARRGHQPAAPLCRPGHRRGPRLRAPRPAWRQCSARRRGCGRLRRSWPEPSAFWRRRPRNTSRSATAVRCGAKESCNTWAASNS